MPAAKELTGQVFGRLTVIKRQGCSRGRANWLCACRCGKAHEAISHALTSGHTKSCGCWKEERNTSTEPSHGHARRSTGKSPTYRSWCAMWTRCTNPKSKEFRYYGARGVVVCDLWKSFGEFLACMGERPLGLTLDRTDYNGNYEPGNCRWSTATEQNRNTRRNRFVLFEGQKMTQAEFSKFVGMKEGTVSYRLRHGWTPEQVAKTKPRGRHAGTPSSESTVSIPADFCP